MYQTKQILLVQCAAIVVGLLYYQLDSRLILQIGVPAWENSLALTLLYGFSLATSAAIALGEKGRAYRYLVPTIALAVCVGLSALTPIGAVTSLLFCIGVIVVLLCTHRFLCGVIVSNGPTFLQAIVYSVFLTAIIGCLWILQVAPAYAEGFVILSWVLLGIYNFLIFFAIHLVFRRLQIKSSFSFPYAIRISAALLATALLGAIGVFYQIWSEAETTPPLEPTSIWGEAFQPFGSTDDADVAGAAVPRFLKSDLVQMLREQDNLSGSQLATLFLLAGDEEAAQQFKRQIILAATQKLYARPEGSVKYGQRLAMLWALYYQEISLRSPELFTQDDKRLIEGWFSAVARRIMTPGWVDYLYAIPFRSMPYGPYLNQEIGAGAVAILRHYTDDNATELNQRIDHFLATLVSGWGGTFRNQDDAYGYQDVWMGSVLGLWQNQMAGTQGTLPTGLKHSMDWVKAQIPLHTFPLNYGLPSDFRPVDTLAIGAFVLQDPESKWLLENQLLKMRELGEELPEELTALYLWDDDMPVRPYYPVSTEISAPTGYTFRPGRLGPDKIVIRGMVEGEDSNRELYALVNLRSSGWHRYPATNTLIRLAVGESPILVEALVKKFHRWLPRGRAGHRDKKVDRSRLNGLLVERTGLDAWVGGITGVYSRWRQDVPRFAAPELSQQVGGFQVAQVEMTGWGGVNQTRTHFMGPEGIFGVHDHINDTRVRDKAISWYFADRSEQGEGQGADVDDNIHWSYQVAAVNNTADAGDIFIEELNDWLPHAMKSAVPSERALVSSDGLNFSTALLVSVEGKSRDVDLVNVELEEIRNATRLSYKKDLERYEIVFGNTEAWENHGVQSDARVARYTLDQAGLELELVDATFVETGGLSGRGRVLWRSAESDHGLGYVKAHSSRLEFGQRSAVQLRVIAQ
jgi:hypothetical protein